MINLEESVLVEYVSAFGGYKQETIHTSLLAEFTEQIEGQGGTVLSAQ